MPKLSKRVTVMLATLSLLFGGAITAAHGQAQAAEGAARVPLAAAAPVSDAVAAAVADQFVESRIGRERTRRAAGDVMVRLAVTRGGNDLRYVSYDRTHSGLPVIGGDAVVVVNGDGEVAFVSVAQTEPIALATLGPAVLPPAAADAARAQFSSVTATGVPRLVVFAVSSPPSLAWDVAVDGTVDGEAARQRVFVNASTGALLARMGRDHDATGRGHYYGTVAINTTLADGVFTMVDSSRANLSCRDVNATTPFTDQDNVWGNGTSEDMVTACVDAMYGAAKTWDMLDAWFGRDGFDGNGGPSIQLKMDSSFLNNGVWLADQRTVLLGKSSQSLRWFSPLDLVGHELGHAVYHFTPGGSIFSNTEANAVNEAVADIFGTLTELFAAHAADPFDYTLGEEIETEPFRFMHDPSLTSGANCYPAEGFPPPSSGTRPPPSPHLAAGVVDHWFYLLAEGSNPTNGGPVSPTCNNRTLKGIGIGKARDIVFNSLLAKTADWQMGQMRLATLNVARNLYPNCVEFIAVRAAWDAVDVGVQAGEPECSMSLFGTADTVNVSDPFVMKCFDQTTGLNGYCMYTSQDLGVLPTQVGDTADWRVSS
jgi:Zn-dependent metalloprotease